VFLGGRGKEAAKVRAAQKRPLAKAKEFHQSPKEMVANQRNLKALRRT
jgi:hypothetical protein